MTVDVLYYTGMVFFGVVLGIVFFGGLWITVQKMATARQPAVLFLLSVIARMAIVLGGIWYVTRGAPGAVLACLAGFFVVRLLATSRVSMDGRQQQPHRGDES